jgi:hypothetical protein
MALEGEMKPQNRMNPFETAAGKSTEEILMVRERERELKELVRATRGKLRMLPAD